MTCKECRFQHKSVCHRFPPVGIEPDAEGAPRVAWSIVGTDDWCGEFVRKDGVVQAKDDLASRKYPCKRCGRTTLHSGNLCSYCDTGNA
jgi:hypothetical protein